MPGGLLFVGQALLDSWAGQGKLDLKGNVMTLLQGEGKGRSYALEPAVRFLKVLGAEVDPNKLLAKVKTHSQLREQGAEVVEDSVIIGETAYEVEPGFLAETAALQAASAAGRAERAPATAPPDAAKKAPAGPKPGARPATPVAAPAAVVPAPAPVPQGAAPVPVSMPEVTVERSSAQLPRELEEKREEAEALARYLLEFLSR